MQGEETTGTDGVQEPDGGTQATVTMDAGFTESIEFTGVLRHHKRRVEDGMFSNVVTLLQQEVQVVRYDANGVTQSVTYEWRDVPMVDEA